MGIGHAAVGLGLKTLDRRLNAGILLFAAFFADFALGWFVWAGWETYRYPLDFEFRHYMIFTFPWSHGLLPGLVFAASLGLLVWACGGATRAILATGIAVVSHFLLDGLVHVQGPPVLGPDSWKLSLGLWNHLPLELTLEAIMMLAGLGLYWQAARDLSRGRRLAMTIYILVLGAFTLIGQATATQTLSRNALIASWIIFPVVFALIAWAIDRQPAVRA
jgi:hypothetical protein